MIDKLKDMVWMQKVLNYNMEKEHGFLTSDVYKDGKVHEALLAEVGELTQEYKPDWGYWKKEQKPFSRQKALEELADVWHFSLIVVIEEWKALRINDRKKYDHDINCFIERSLDRYSCAYAAHRPYILKRIILNANPTTILSALLQLTESLGFTFDEIYEAYMAKNMVNHERLANGY